MTQFIVTLADNGYAVESDNGEFLSVYQGENIPDQMAHEFIAELEDCITNGAASRFRVSVTVEPLEGYKLTE